jgi:hypothetical protein
VTGRRTGATPDVEHALAGAEACCREEDIGHRLQLAIDALGLTNPASRALVVPPVRRCCCHGASVYQAGLRQKWSEWAIDPKSDIREAERPGRSSRSHVTQPTKARLMPSRLLPRSVRLVIVSSLALFGVAVAAPAEAKGAKQSASTPSGYDVGYPQCGRSLPTNATFGIVGVNNGIVFSANPCLGTGNGPSELAWAQQAGNHAPAFYANTGNPGPAYSSHWPTGQTTPQVCAASQPNSTSCSYDYGWNAAKDSFATAVRAETQVNAMTTADATGAAAAATWWLDVETSNSWQTLESAYGPTLASKQNDTSALAGAVAALQSSGVARVGFYSTSYQWGVITGGSAVTGSQFASNPNWLAGYTSQTSASRGCTSPGFTGGRVELTQWVANSLDHDWRCP